MADSVPVTEFSMLEAICNILPVSSPAPFPETMGVMQSALHAASILASAVVYPRLSQPLQ